MAIDILQVEDNHEHLGHTGIFFNSHQAPDKGELIQTSSVEDFIRQSRLRPSISRFLLDGKFPNAVGGDIEFNLPTILTFLQEQARHIERIVIHSAEDLRTLNEAIPEGMDRSRIQIMRKFDNDLGAVIQAIMAH